MLIPIALGLGWPDRVPEAASAVDWSRAQAWEFFPLDNDAFPAVRLARAAGSAGGVAPAVYNAANEVCVEAFRAGSLPFTGIVRAVEEVLSQALSGGWAHVRSKAEDLTVDDVLAADARARAVARDIVQSTADEGTLSR
jgi:1-deoxy-D-xylulose-5-phosphate reductoisomerase